MTTVTLTGWHDGLRYFDLVRLLMGLPGLKLKTAKEYLDQLLDGQSVRLSVADEATATAFLAQARELGAVAEWEFDKPNQPAA